MSHSTPDDTDSIESTARLDDPAGDTSDSPNIGTPSGDPPTSNEGGQETNFSLPSPSRKLVIGAGAAVAVAAITWYLHRRHSSDDSDESAMSEGDDLPTIPADPDDPLAGDEIVVDAMTPEGDS